MAKSAKYYNVDEFNDSKRKLGKFVPPRTNVIAAASYLQAFFNAKKFTWGFMGGLPMLCLGYKREMPDLHIAYDDKDFERLRSKLESDHRYASVSSSCLLFRCANYSGFSYLLVSTRSFHSKFFCGLARSAKTITAPLV